MTDFGCLVYYCVVHKGMADSESFPPTSVRIPLELKAAVVRRAKAEARTFSQQVIYLLERYVASTPEPPPKSRKS